MNIVYSNIKILARSIMPISNVYNLPSSNNLPILLVSRLYSYDIRFLDIIRLGTRSSSVSFDYRFIIDITRATEQYEFKVQKA